MSTMRTTAALAAESKHHTQSSLENHFQPAFERIDEAAVSVIEHIYKKGTSQQAHVNLRFKPKTAEDFYTLAVAIHNNKLAEREDSYFFADKISTPLEAQHAAISEEMMEFSISKESLEKKIKELKKSQTETEQLSETYASYKRSKLVEIQIAISDLQDRIDDELTPPMTAIQARMAVVAQQIAAQESRGEVENFKETFVGNLLLDAVQDGYQPDIGFLAQLLQNPAYSAFAQPIQRLIMQQGYELIKNQGKKTYLNLWSKRVPPRSIAELEELAQDIETQGPVGTYYFLAEPRGIDVLVQTLRKLATDNRARGSHWIEEQLVELRTLARAGKLEEATKLTQALLETGTEVYTEKAHVDRLTQVTQDLLQLALSPKASETQAQAPVKETVLKTTGHHKQPLKQPQLAAGITLGMLSANASTLHAQPRLSPNGVVSSPSSTVLEEVDQPGLPVATTLTFA